MEKRADFRGGEKNQTVSTGNPEPRKRWGPRKE